MAIVLPEDPRERTAAMVKLVRGKSAEYEVRGTTYVTVPKPPTGDAKAETAKQEKSAS